MVEEHWISWTTRSFKFLNVIMTWLLRIFTGCLESKCILGSIEGTDIKIVANADDAILLIIGNFFRRLAISWN